jgi:Hemerythrin HHE cation binding domain
MMKRQHTRIEEFSDRVMAAADAWCENASRQRRHALAGSLDVLVALLHEHLSTEEDSALPLAARRMSGAEWTRMGRQACAAMPPGTMDLIFGMTLYEAAPEDVAEILSTLSPDMREVLIDEGTRVFAAYAERIHGTATPRRSRQAPIN